MPFLEVIITKIIRAVDLGYRKLSSKNKQKEGTPGFGASLHCETEANKNGTHLLFLRHS
jgi:hypothetical protein